MDKQSTELEVNFMKSELEIDFMKFHKMAFIFNALDNGWTINADAAKIYGITNIF